MVVSISQYYQKGGPTDVAITDGGTDSSTAAAARTALGITVYDATTDETAHDILDHAGLTGVPGASGIQFFESGATEGQVQTALNDGSTSIVIIEHNANISLTTNLTVPIGKTLMGSGSKNAYIQYGATGHFAQSSSGRITLNEASRLKDIRINATADPGSSLVSGSGNGMEVIGCYMDWNSSSVSVGRYLIDFTGGGGWLVSDCNLSIQGVAGNASGGVQFTPVGNLGRNTIRDTIVFGNSSGNAGQHAFDVATHYHLDNCIGMQCGGMGFRFNSSNSGTLNNISHSMALSNGTNGFECVGLTAGQMTALVSCYAQSNVGIGFNLPQAGTLGTGRKNNCATRLNGTPNTIGAGWWDVHPAAI